MISTTKNSLQKVVLICLIAGALLGGVLYSSRGFISETPEDLDALATEDAPPTLVDDVEPAESAVTPAPAEAKEQTNTFKKLSPIEQKKWTSFKEILASKNDNDPRINGELKNLSDDFHSLLYSEYQTLPAESRNERGMIVFLLTRDLRTDEDFAFLRKVYDEAPCLSLGDCNSRSQSDPHLSGIDQTTMNYPQLAELYQIEDRLTREPKLLEDTNMRENFKATIDAALKFPVPIVQKKAAEIKAKFFP